MKVIIQIPCFNESTTLPETIRDLPETIPGVEVVEYLVIDDGSRDGTAEVAHELGVHHVLRLKGRQGLGRAYATGLAEALRLGADIIVNTDGDNQYCGADVEKLVKPLLEDQADIVVGARPIETIEHFSRTKKWLQSFGSRMVSRFSGTEVEDATSGFRALSRNAALRINVFSKYTYTLEMLIQAGRSGMRVMSVPISVNPPRRPSRLISSIPNYIQRSLVTILRVFALYAPLRFFAYLGLVWIIPGALLGSRFLYYYAQGQGQGKIQSLILAAILIIIGFQLAIVGLVADLISKNRRILEEVQYLERLRHYQLHEASDGGNRPGQRLQQAQDPEPDRAPDVSGVSEGG